MYFHRIRRHFILHNVLGFRILQVVLRELLILLGLRGWGGMVTNVFLMFISLHVVSPGNVLVWVAFFADYEVWR